MTVRGLVDQDGWLVAPGVLLHLNDFVAFKAGAEGDEHDTSFLLGARFHS